MPPPGQTLQIQLQIKTDATDDRATEDSALLQTEGVSLMQTRVAQPATSMSASLQSLPGRILPFLQPELRAPVVRRVQNQLRTLHTVIKLMLQEMEMFDLPYSWGSDEAGPDLVDTISNRLLLPIMNLIDGGQVLRHTHSGASSSTPATISTREQGVQTDDLPDVPQLEATQCAMAVEAAGCRVDMTVDGMFAMILEDIDDHTHDRHAVLRQVLRILLQQGRNRAARLRLLLHVVSRLVPQPNLLSSGTAAEEEAAQGMAEALVSKVLMVLNSVSTDMDETGHGTVLDASWAAQQAGAPGSMAMDVISFLENDQWDDDSVASNPTETATASPDSHMGEAQEAMYGAGDGGRVRAGTTRATTLAPKVRLRKEFRRKGLQVAKRGVPRVRKGSKMMTRARVIRKAAIRHVVVAKGRGLNVMRLRVRRDGLRPRQLNRGCVSSSSQSDVYVMFPYTSL